MTPAYSSKVTMCITRLKLYTLLLLCTFLLFFGVLCHAQEANIQGGVFKAADSSAIANCQIAVMDNNNKFVTSAITDNNGVFLIVINPKYKNEALKMQVSHLNYITKILPVIPNSNKLNIFLYEKEFKLQEVIIHSSYKSGNKGNSYVFSPAEAASSISVIGEPDIVRHISSLPGVSQGIEGTLGLFVRGGNNGSNSVIFNQVPIYNFTHLLGMFSTFSPEIISESKFYMGGIPAEYGNLSSSVINIETKNTTDSIFRKKITLSPYMTGGYISLPVVKNKLTLNVSGRTSFIPYFVGFFTPEDVTIKAQVLDFTSILNWTANRYSNIDLMFYVTNDYFDFKDTDVQSVQNWGAKAVKIGWNYVFSPKVKLSAWTYYSDAFGRQENTNFDIAGSIRSSLKLSSEQNETSINSQLAVQVKRNFSAKAGSSFSFQQFFPTTEKNVISDKIKNVNEQHFNNQLFSAFSEITYKVPDVISLTLGYRHYFQQSMQNFRNNYDLHFLSDITLSKNLGIETSCDQLTQYYHVLEGLPTGWPLNITIPSSGKFPEEISRQIYTGLFWKYVLSDTRLSLTAGGYYRNMKNIVSYKSTINLFGLTDATWEDEIDKGEGTSYGLESSFALQNSRLGTTLAYTLSKTNRRFPQINNGETFPFKFDRRHILNLQSKVTTYKGVNRKGKQREQYVNVVLSYSTGNKATLPIATYQGEMLPFWNLRPQGWQTPQEFNQNSYNRQLMSGANEFSMRDYFRIDMAYSFIFTNKKRTGELSLSVFNILNRKNPYLYFYQDNKWQQLSLITIMPSVRWTYEF